jgi:hypothetical protein
MIDSHGFTPVSDGAFGVAGGHVDERLLRFLVLKLVQNRDALFDRWLHARGTARGETHVAELVGRRRSAAEERKGRRRDEQSCNDNQPTKVGHGTSYAGEIVAHGLGLEERNIAPLGQRG